MAPIRQTILTALATTTSFQPATANIQYRSRPDLVPPTLNITRPSPNATGSEYVFIAPYSTDSTLARPGAYIYRKNGDLVWAGTGYYAGFVANFLPTTYHGETVLQAFQGSMDGAHGEGFGQHVLLDQSYQHVVTSTASRHRVSSIHEFNVIGGETALVEIFATRPADLSAYGGNSSQQWLGNGIFQENDIATGQLVFEWDAFEHVDPSESLVPLGSTSANSGLSATEAWDYFHINSIDKNEEGDYLLSSRHTSTIFKINGTDGSIIWRLGGKYPSFSQTGDWNFGFQHHARWQPRLSKPGIEVLSFFDNSVSERITYNDVSRALVVQINHTDHSATILRQATAPYGLRAQSQGNAQLLLDDRIFVNWGSEGAFTEFGPDNEILYHAFIQTGAVSYRGFLGNWTGTPKESPALVALKASPNLVELYVSWNGDTRASAWRFYYVKEQQKVRVGQVTRESFETVLIWRSTFVLSSDARFIAEAVDGNGVTLTETDLVATTAGLELNQANMSLTEVNS